MVRSLRLGFGAVLVVALLRASTACWTPIASDIPASRDDSGAPDSGDKGGGTQADFYVDLDPSSSSYKTITAAAQAASLSSASGRTIHVAAGTYSTNSGETFPITLRGVSLVGAGPGVTAIVGTGTTDATPPAVAIESTVRATFVAGDTTAATTIAHVSIMSGDDVVTAGSEAILCDRGNVIVPGPAVANTTIDDVTFDRFDIGLRVAASHIGTASSGCSALVRGSTFENGTFGVMANGANNGTASSQLVAIQVGDDSLGTGNAFHDLHHTKSDRAFPVQYNASAVLVLSAVTGVAIKNNRITACDTGVWMWDHIGGDRENGAVIVGNDLRNPVNAGVSFMENVVVARLESNSIREVSTGTFADLNWSGVGVLLNNYSSPAFPVVRHARNNVIFANDVGVALRVYGDAQVTADERSDFGTADDPGGNTIRCNGRGLRANAQHGDGWPGSDVETTFAFPSPVTFAFEGNTWDHATPGTSPPLELLAGIDLILSNAQVDTANPKTDTSPCPATVPIGPPPPAPSN